MWATSCDWVKTTCFLAVTSARFGSRRSALVRPVIKPCEINISMSLKTMCRCHQPSFPLHLEGLFSISIFGNIWESYQHQNREPAQMKHLVDGSNEMIRVTYHQWIQFRQRIFNLKHLLINRQNLRLKIQCKLRLMYNITCRIYPQRSRFPADRACIRALEMFEIAWCKSSEVRRHRRGTLEFGDHPLGRRIGFGRSRGEYVLEWGFRFVCHIRWKFVWFIGYGWHVADIDGSPAWDHRKGPCRLQKRFIPAWECSPRVSGLIANY